MSSYLVASEAFFLVHGYRERGCHVCDLDMGWSAEVTIGVITMTECQRVHTVMVSVIGFAVIEKASDAATLWFSRSATDSWQRLMH